MCPADSPAWGAYRVYGWGGMWGHPRTGSSCVVWGHEWGKGCRDTPEARSGTPVAFRCGRHGDTAGQAARRGACRVESTGTLWGGEHECGGRVDTAQWEHAWSRGTPRGGERAWGTGTRRGSSTRRRGGARGAGTRVGQAGGCGGLRGARGARRGLPLAVAG